MDAMPADLETILQLEVPILVRIAERRLPADEIVRWVPGVIVEMNKHVDEELDLLVNNVAIAKGRAVKVGENFGMRITVAGGLKDRIHAIAGRDQADAGNGESASSEAENAIRRAKEILSREV